MSEVNSSKIDLLRNLPFDLTFVLGVAFISLLSGVIVTSSPHLFQTVLFLDLWFLGYHHVVSTFTRLAFDKKSIQENNFIVTKLPIIVVVAVVGVVLWFGPWILATTYLYWQWFHYTRQSYGIARIYKCKTDPTNTLLDQGALYLLPILGILVRSRNNNGYFLGMELRTPHIPDIVISIVVYLTICVTCLWIIKQMISYFKGDRQPMYNSFMASHFIIFYVAYIGIKDINAGWLVINIWHNAQYVLFVWMFNNKRFNNKPDPEHKLISWMSQNKNILPYFLICFAISTFFYFTTSKILGLITFSSLPFVIIFYQTINFHHYMVDAMIWKVRKRPIRETLNLK